MVQGLVLSLCDSYVSLTRNSEAWIQLVIFIKLMSEPELLSVVTGVYDSSLFSLIGIIPVDLILKPYFCFCNYSLTKFQRWFSYEQPFSIHSGCCHW